MSNLVKNGFQSFGGSNKEPFVIDFSKKDFGEAKIIRSVEEKKSLEEAGEKETTQVNEAVLNDALDKAKILRDDAVLKASLIISDANEQAEKIKEDAYNEGYETGLKDGNMEAMKRADEYLANIQKEQDEIINAQKHQLEQCLEQSKQAIVDFSCKIIEKMTGIIVDEYEPVMLYMINSALKEAETSKYFMIKVSEKNFVYVSDNRERLVGATNPGVSIEIFSDAGLDDRQCIVETDNGIIDLSLDVQIRNLILAIKMLSE